MIIKLKDRTEIVASINEADKVKQAIENGAVGIELGQKWFRADFVASIMPGGNTEAEYNDKQIEAPDYRGLDSAAKEKIRQYFKEKNKD